MSNNMEPRAWNSTHLYALVVFVPILCWSPWQSSGPTRSSCCWFATKLESEPPKLRAPFPVTTQRKGDDQCRSARQRRPSVQASAAPATRHRHPWRIHGSQLDPSRLWNSDDFHLPAIGKFGLEGSSPPLEYDPTQRTETIRMLGQQVL